MQVVAEEQVLLQVLLAQAVEVLVQAKMELLVEQEQREQ
jgi:hypothetical protein